MRISVAAALACLSVSCVSPDDAQQAALVGADIEILSHCPDTIPACVRMTLSDTSRVEPPLGDSTGYARVRLSVRGSLGDDATADTTLVVRSFTDGHACSSLGQATVAVVGFSDRGEPIILTTHGPFTLVASTLDVGCKDCALLLSATSADTIAALRTPAWDFSEVGRRLTDLNFDDTGTLFVRGDSVCLALSMNARVVEAPNAACAPMTEIGNFASKPSRILLQPAEWLFSAPPQKHLLLVKSGACT